ncbi:hypothetical protein I7I53_00138 [Histoplasma capsulatum var. duboisii H88]|uniref:Uncharacterized protein n=1 Tax=Ajellomyces capsulatus (strain H88) TaxID=544711 RepID=A0A8A1LGI8_AJEC8|nr:hypothetical protein I7I53_00138 [Histoplasma capsulatum var. duboisii H88]
MSDDQIIWKLEPFPEPYEEERKKARDEIYNYFISAQLPSNKAAISAPCSKSTLKTEIVQEYQRITGCSRAAHHYMGLIFTQGSTTLGTIYSALIVPIATAGEASISISKSENKRERSERLSWDGSHSILIMGESDINVIIESGNGRFAARVGFFEREQQ